MFKSFASIQRNWLRLILNQGPAVGTQVLLDWCVQSTQSFHDYQCDKHDSNQGWRFRTSLQKINFVWVKRTFYTCFYICVISVIFWLLIPYLQFFFLELCKKASCLSQTIFFFQNVCKRNLLPASRNCCIWTHPVPLGKSGCRDSCIFVCVWIMPNFVQNTCSLKRRLGCLQIIHPIKVLVNLERLFEMI